MANHLSNQTSPYLLQHADNPVDWYPWGEEALQKAVKEDKPIFLSIGYSSCHWCHVMAYESFEDEDVAKVLNQFFVPVKVDREERPDIDSLYMSSVVAMTGQGGWPMSVFLKPTGEPFFAGTYFPPERRYGMPGFKEVLFHIRHIWRVNRNEIEKVAENTIRHLEMVNRFTNSDENSFSLETLQSASARLVENFDYQLQGWGPAPLFPHPLTLEFLLSQYSRARSDGIMAVVSGNLKAMARGGIWDLIGGGFHRYSTDDRWHIPHYEKMLTDNAQLALVYLHAFLVNGDGEFKNVTERTLDFILRELMSPEGGFFSSLDADSEGEEGLYYTWTDLEIQDALSNQADWELVQQVFDLEPAGRIVLRRKMNDQEAAQFFNLPIQDFEYRLRVVMRKLLTARFMRIRPTTDDKIIASWTSLAGQAFVEGARFLNRPDYLLAAQKSAEFLRAKMIKDGRVFRSYRGGQTSPQHGFLEDYAASILFLLDLYQLDHNQEWFSLAKELAGTMISLFADEAGGFFDTQADDAPLVVRPRSVQDNAVPSGGALAARALLLLAEMDGIAEWRMMAEDALSGVYELAVAHPLAFSAWLQAADLAVGPVFQAAVVWPAQAAFPVGMEANIQAHYNPRLVSAFSPLPLKKGAPALLSDRLPINGQATAFVCQGFTCLQPTTDAGEMARQLKVE